MDISPEEAYDMVVYQVGSLYGFVRGAGGAHGARQSPRRVVQHNMAAKDAALAQAIAEAVYKVAPSLILFGLSGSELVKAG